MPAAEPSAAAPQAAEAPVDRILTAANAFTALRLACIPVVALLLVRDHGSDREAAAWLLAALGATDWVDGQLARRLHQVSSLGKVLDPLADRLLLATAAVTSIAVGAVPVWVAVAALVREAVVAVGFVYVAAAGGRRMDVNLAGKAATFLLMVALPLFIIGHSRASWHGAGEAAAWVPVLPALVLGWVSTIAYVGPARRLVAEGRVGRAAPAQ
ncbi:MAG TPA: CDP-alcohol phosphatidyltransferase family protein [Acidimicrobiales bacterium]|nr:CDP-alcohol phosphatidyltransferase family protein [Acidimicrobiales bacterium]